MDSAGGRNLAPAGRISKQTLTENRPWGVTLKIRRLTVLATLVATFSGLTAASASHELTHPSEPPANDSRENATLVTDLPYTDEVNNTLATTEAGESDCSGYGSVWYSFTPTANMAIVADTSGSSFDTLLAIHKDDDWSPEACDDDHGGTLQSYIRLDVTAGQKLHFMISGFGRSFGDIVFNLSVGAPIPRPANDNRADATVIAQIPFEEETNDSLATLEDGETSRCDLDRTLWYRFTSTETSLLTTSISSSTYGPGIAIYAAGNLVDPIACTSDSYWSSSIRFTASVGQTYYFQVGHIPGTLGNEPDAGYLRFSLRGSPTTSTRARDSIETAASVTSLPYRETVSTEGLTLDPGEPSPCGFVGATAWYRLVAPATGAVDVVTKDSSFDTVVAVYSAADRERAITCNDDLDGVAGGVRFDVELGSEYLIQIGGRKGGTGNLEVSILAAAPEPPLRSWGSPEGKPIGPGASIGNCTANFIFEGRGIRAGRVYLGTAAHCVRQDVGSWIYLYDDDPLLGSVVFEDPIGTVAYSSHKEIDAVSVECYLILTCTPDDGFNDFALIEISHEFLQYVHPSMRHFGGPTSIAAFDEVAVGDKIVSFGNSGLRPGPEALDWHEGYVSGKYGDMEVDVTMTPGIFGDSGSPVILADGRALGVLVTLGGNEPGTNGVTTLQPAMDVAADGGWNIVLCTSEMIDRGVLP